MPALIIIDLTPIDKSKLDDYSTFAAASLLPFGGEFLIKGPIEMLHGEPAHQTKVVIQFPDRNSALSWYNSEEYQGIITLRNQGMKSQFHLVG